MQESTAITLFVYNRPNHTRQVLNALARCSGLNTLPLIIFSDGAKSPKDLQVESVRSLIRKFEGPKSVHVIERPKNLGLAQNITSGITEVLESYDRIIVLEDDIVLSKGALTYFQNALDQYQEHDQVMHISGYNWPIQESLPETFLFRGISCWGWATWKQAWKHYEADVDVLIQKIRDENQIEAFNLDGAQPYFDHLLANQKGEIKTWAIRWQASIFLNGGLSLMPGKSMVQNVGFDATGVHSQVRHEKRFSHKTLVDQVKVKPLNIQENKQAYQAIRTFFMASRNRGRRARLKAFFAHLIGKS